MRIVCQQTILMKYHALFVIFEKRQIFNRRLLQIIGGALWVKVGVVITKGNQRRVQQCERSLYLSQALHITNKERYQSKSARRALALLNSSLVSRVKWGVIQLIAY